MDIVTAIAQFKLQLQAQGYAPGSVRSYSDFLLVFKRYLDEQQITDLKAVNHQMVLDYQAQVMTRPWAGETKALSIRSIKRLFEFLVDAHQLLINPTEGLIETCRRTRSIGMVLTQEEMQRLLAQPNLSLRSQIRDRAVLEVLYATGIRIGELVNVEVYHVDLKDQVIYIRKGKGQKQRVVPLGKTAGHWLREYLEKIRSHYVKKNPKERRLFLTNSGRVLTGNNIRAFLRYYCKKAGIDKTVSPHTFRRSCATHLIQQGADIRYVQQLLGHTYLKTTQYYTKVLPVEVKRTHERTHPNQRQKPGARSQNPEGRTK
jgi:integrase/recombinase XerD